MTASQPFTTTLIASNLAMFKYTYVWCKSKGCNFTHAKNMPLKFTEDIAVFSKASIGHAPQLGEKRMEIAHKNLEISFMEKRINNLTEENNEVDELRLNYEKQKLELENLRAMQSLLKTTKSTTQDKLKAMAPKTLAERAKETAVLAAVGTLTTAGVTSVLAFIIFLVRLYMAAN